MVPESATERESTKITADYVNSIIKKIIKYKQNKVLHFEDFL